MIAQLAQIIVNPALQPRIGGLDPTHVRELEEAPDSWPPLAVVNQKGAFILVDGFHRLAAAQNIGLTEVPVKVLDVPDDGDLHALAFFLNAAHGRPLTLTDRRAFAARLLRQHPEWADREIGRRCGLAQPTVARVRESLEETEEIEPLDTRIGRDGRTYRVPAAEREPGELPEPGLLAALGDMVTPDERRQQRRLAQYLERLAVALDDQYELDGWSDTGEAAKACRLVLGNEKAAKLGARLGEAASDILAESRFLGYEDAGHAE